MNSKQKFEFYSEKSNIITPCLVAFMTMKWHIFEAKNYKDKVDFPKFVFR